MNTADELLKRAVLEFEAFHGFQRKLKEEIRAYLATPRTEQEPVKLDHVHQWVRTGAMPINKYRCITCGLWGEEGALDPAPKRKPLSDEEIESIFGEYDYSRNDLYGFIEGFRLAEKIHGISGGEDA